MTTIDIPDNWLPTSENINALPRPLRDLFMRLHANTDPAGELRRAMIAEMERDALRVLVHEVRELAQAWERRANNVMVEVPGGLAIGPRRMLKCASELNQILDGAQDERG